MKKDQAQPAQGENAQSKLGVNKESNDENVSKPINK